MTGLQATLAFAKKLVEQGVLKSNTFKLYSLY